MTSPVRRHSVGGEPLTSIGVVCFYFKSLTIDNSDGMCTEDLLPEEKVASLQN